MPFRYKRYINDIGFLPDVLFKPKLYADDTNIFVYSHSIKDLQVKAQDTLDKVSVWVAANRLTVNVDKTCFMIFRPSSIFIDLSQLTLHLNSRVLSRVTSTKFLGVTIDDELTWTNHIQNLCLHLRTHIGIFYKLRSFVPAKIMRTLLYTPKFCME